ncbi:MAG: hypothetical protein L0I24_13495 [Pseudonocardia sp.]|nr:hypothetical protein [Pseudonocardia sp.]
MIAAPLATVDVPVDLPGSTATPQPRPDEPAQREVADECARHLVRQLVA